MLAAEAKHYIVSTNGAIFGHPNEEAMARVILKGGSQRKIWFNYRTEHTAKWGDLNLQRKHGFSAELPAGDQTVVRIALMGSALHGTK